MLNKKKEEPHKQIDKAALLHRLGDDEWTAIVERPELTPPLFNSLSLAGSNIHHAGGKENRRAKPGRRQTGPEKSAAL